MDIRVKHIAMSRLAVEEGSWESAQNKTDGQGSFVWCRCSMITVNEVNNNTRNSFFGAEFTPLRLMQAHK